MVAGCSPFPTEAERSRFDSTLLATSDDKSQLMPPAHTPSGAPDLPVQAAIETLAEELEIAPNEIRLIAVTPMEWRDESLGCPKPGRMYAQVITPGYRIILAADGQRYEYHTDVANRAVRCGPPGVDSLDEPRSDIR